MEAASIALGTTYKWLDNLLSHHAVPGVERHRQGVSRTLSADALRVIAIALVLIRELGVPASRAVALAARLSDGSSGALSRDVQVRADLDAIDDRLREGLVHALAATPPRRRGRPRSATVAVERRA